MSETIVTRFAPSPTGFLHIGGARTALFNWLYARGRGGKMLLRIEDTDRERSTQAAIDAILDGLTWLGLHWDDDTVYQFSRSERHREVAHALLEAGRAYRCYATPEELAEMREKARSEGRAKLYDGRWRDRDPSEAPPGVAPVIRLKAPLTGETVIEDQVQGRVVWQNENLDDLVLLRSDGTPTYMLAVVVDDHDMGVTHVIRGDDHLTNAARQTQIFNALGWRVPVMAHIRPMDERDVRHHRNAPAQRIVDLRLSRGVGEVIVAPDDMGYAHVVVVHHDGEHVSRRAVRTQQHEVIEVFVLPDDPPLHLIFDHGFAGQRRLEPDHRRNSGRGFRRVAVAPAAVVELGTAFTARLLAHLGEFLGRGIATIGAARLQ